MHDLQNILKGNSHRNRINFLAGGERNIAVEIEIVRKREREREGGGGEASRERNL